MVRLIASSNALGGGGEALLSPNNVFLSMTCAVGLYNFFEINICYGFGNIKAINLLCQHSLVPRPLPDFISQLWRKIGRRLGIKTTSQTGNGGLG